MPGSAAPSVTSFRWPQTSLGSLDAAQAAAVVTASADIALVVDRAGVIRDMALPNAELSAELPNAEGWVGRAFADTAAPDSRIKIEALLRPPANDAEPRWRHVNCLSPQGASVPVLFAAAPLGEDGRRLMVGRDLRAAAALQQRLVNAQQAMERDYARLRETETRYRLLFQTAAEAVLILDAARLRVTEANPAAARLLGATPEQLAGTPLAELFAAAGLDAVQTHLAAVRAGARPGDTPATLANGHTAVAVAAALFRQDSVTLFLLRLAPAGTPATAAPLAEARARLLAAVEQAPDAFVVTDTEGGLVAANASFLELAQLASDEQARGAPLDRWLGQSPLDVNVLMANLRNRGSIRFFATSLRGEHGATTPVEVSAVATDTRGRPGFGFAIRNVGPRLRTGSRIGRELPRSVEQLTELIGRVALKDLVREATDVIERLCIEAALELTDDNRASAAEMLGLSRQSLYVKLRRYGLGDLDGDVRN